MKGGDYREGDTIYLLMRCREVQGMLEDWLREDADCALIVHRSRKTPGHVVVETTSLGWAYRVMRWYKVERVSIKRQRTDTHA